MDEMINKSLTQTKLWKRILCIFLSVIIAIGTFITLTFGNSRFQKWLGISSVLSAYAAEIVDTKGASSINEEAMRADNRIIDLNLKDGTNTTYMFSEPISFIDENGELKIKDVTIEKADAELRSKGYDYTNGQNDYRINFSKESSKGLLIELGSISYSIIPQGQRNVIGAESSTMISNEKFENFEYENIYGEGTNLKFYPQLNGVKDEITLSADIGLYSYSFEIRTENCEAVLNEDGTVSILNDGDVVQSFSAPFAFDSKYVEGVRDAHYSDCKYKLDKVDAGKYVLTIEVDEDWMKAPSTVYPVTIDPVTGHISNMYDLPIHKNRTTTGATVDTNAVGFSEEYIKSCSLIKFQKPSDIKNYDKINSAYYWLRELTGRTSNFDCGVHKINGSWNENTVWSTCPSFNVNATSSRNINSASTDYAQSPYWYKFDITSLVREWYSGTTNYGFMLRYDSDNPAYNLRTFAHLEYSSSAWRPYTVINYTPDRTAPTATVTKKATGWTNKNVTLKIENAQDNAGGAGMHAKPYSFYATGDGYSWGTSDTGTYASNRTVYVSVRDAVDTPNIRTYTVTIDNIDKLKPNAPKLSGVPTGWTNQNVTITASATDAAATNDYGKSGIKDYSFSTEKGKYSWQTSSSKTYSESTKLYIYARDNATNTSNYTYADIKIDKAKPVIRSIDIEPAQESGKITVTIEALDSDSGIKQYTVNNVTKMSNEDDCNIFEIDENDAVNVCVEDNAGNRETGVTQLESLVFYNENNLLGIYNPNDYSLDIEYKIDEGSWTDYTGPFSTPINEAATVKARFKGLTSEEAYETDAHGYDEYTSYKVGETDLTIKNNNASFDIYREYDSRTNEWYFSTESSISEPHGDFCYTAKLPDGTVTTFIKSGENTYTSELTGYTLTVEDEGYTVDTGENMYLYNSLGILVCVSDGDNCINFSYDENNHLALISYEVDGESYEYPITVNADGKIVSITTPISEKLIYEYQNYDLKKVYYDKSFLQYSKNADILISEYSYSDGKMSYDGKRHIEYADGSLHKVTEQNGAETVYAYQTRLRSDYDIGNVENDYTVYEFSTNDDIVCYNSFMLPVLSIYGDMATVYEYNGQELAKQTEYKKNSDDVYVLQSEEYCGDEVENEPQCTYYDPDEMQHIKTKTANTVEDEFSVETVTGYDFDGRIVSEEVTRRKDNEVVSTRTDEYEYYDDTDSVHNLSSTYDEGASSTQTLTTYDNDGNVLSENVTYFKNNEQISTETTTSTYDDASGVLSQQNEIVVKNDVTTETNTEYDNLGRETRVSVTTTKNDSVDSEISLYEYDSLGNVKYYTLTTTDANENTSIKKLHYCFDELNRNTAVYNVAAGNEESLLSECKYSPVGNVIYKSEEGKVTRSIYDEYSRLVQEIPNECYSDADDMIVSDGADSYRDANVGNRYYYSTATGNLSREINSVGVETEYTYYQNTSDVETEAFSSYLYTYNRNGDIDNVKVNNHLYADYVYNDGSLLTDVNYGNGQSVHYAYNGFDQIATQQYRETPDSAYEMQFRYVYTDNAENAEASSLVAKYDYTLGQKSVYSDDGTVTVYDLTYSGEEEVLTLRYSYHDTEADEEQSVNASLSQSFAGTALNAEYTENSTVYSENDTELFRRNYTATDSRNGTATIVDKVNGTDHTVLNTEYTTADNNDVTITHTYSNNVTETSSYHYDDKGRLVEYSPKANSVVNYHYDDKGQLVREDYRYGSSSSTYVYAYDSRGNLTGVKLYDYTTDEIIYESANSSERFSFSYDNDIWLDEITEASNTYIVYDEQGNLAKLEECDFNWTNGRQLESITYEIPEENLVIPIFSYTYDENGIRTSKTYLGETTYYTTIDGTITSQYQLDGQGNKIEKMVFLYDKGELIGVRYSGNNYYYIKNNMGDVTAIINSDGDKIAEYFYNAWGDCESFGINAFSGTADYELANNNPMRYRGYYYDSELNMYYLQSRYYLPQWCRFLNSDFPEYAQMQKALPTGTNLFAYCCNDPVNNVDYEGHCILTNNNQIYHDNWEISLKYNPDIAYKYAKKWYSDKGENTAYHYYSNGDCANFVSQCLHVGGLLMNSKWHSFKSTCYRKGFNFTISDRKWWKVSDSWNLASCLKDYLESSLMKSHISEKTVITKISQLNSFAKKIYKKEKCSAVFIAYWTETKKNKKIVHWHAMISGEVVKNGSNYNVYYFAHTQSRDGTRNDGKGVKDFIGRQNAKIYAFIIV